MAGGVYKGDGIFELIEDTKIQEEVVVVVSEPVAAEAVVELNPVADEVVE